VLSRLYVSSPTQTLKNIAAISKGKSPGEIAIEKGMGNANFNAGLKKDNTAFAYEIVMELHELKNPLPLEEVRIAYKATFPQRYSYVPRHMIEDIILDEQTQSF
jgi:hypothetical protein